MALCRIGRVGICHVVGGEFEVGCLLGVYHYAAANVHGLLQSVVPYGHLVEERPLVEAYYAMFGHVLTVNLLGIVNKFECESQRTVVQHAIFLEAIWHDDAVAEHDGGRSASQTGTYVVAVETCAVVKMQRNGLVERVGFLLAAVLAHLRRDAMAVVNNRIALLNVRIWSALEPHVHAESLLSGALQGGSVSPIRATVVLPYKVVHSPGIQFSLGKALCRIWCARFDIELGCTSGYDGSLYK